MRKMFIRALLCLVSALFAADLSAQTMTINCSNTTGSELGVTVVLKSPAGKSDSFRCDNLETKSFENELKEAGEYSLTVIFRENGGRRPVIPFGVCKFTVTGAESSVKADVFCGLTNMVVPCNSLSSNEYSNRCHGILTVRKFYPRTAGTEMTLSDNISEKGSSWDISVTSLSAEQ